MRKILLGIALAMSLYGCDNHKYDVKPTKYYWRQIDWNRKVEWTESGGDTLKDEGIHFGFNVHCIDKAFILKKQEGNIKIYRRSDENFCLGKECLDSVEYYFYKDTLMKVVVSFGMNSAEAIKAYTEEEYGKASGINRHDHIFWGEQVYKEYDGEDMRNKSRRYYNPSCYRYSISLGPVVEDTSNVFTLEYVNTEILNKWLEEPKPVIKEIKQESPVRKELNQCPFH